MVGVKPGFNRHEENGVSAFEAVNERSFPGKWKVIYFYPKDFTFVCPTEIVGFARLAQDFADRDAVVLGRSTDNEFAKLGWRRDQRTSPVSTTGSSPTSPVRSSTSSACATRNEGVALRATFVVDPDNVIQHVSVNNLNVGRNPERDPAHSGRAADRRALPCNRSVGGGTCKRIQYLEIRLMQFINILKERLPDYAKDVRLNLDHRDRAFEPVADRRGGCGARCRLCGAGSSPIVDAILRRRRARRAASAGGVDRRRADGHEQRLVPVRRNG